VWEKGGEWLWEAGNRSIMRKSIMAHHILRQNLNASPRASEGADQVADPQDLSDYVGT
jgi:hypothetical protein